MTAMPPASHRTEAFHLARSRVIDAFGELELEIVALLRGAEAKVLKAPLSQKIAATRKIEPSPRYSKKRREAVHLALDKLTPFLARRAEIAHSAMQFVRIIGEADERAGFSNPADQPERGERIVLYRVQDLIDLANDVRAIARELAGPISPASSLPRPLPAAAGGP
jgi:hypothetical protein